MTEQFEQQLQLLLSLRQNLMTKFLDFFPSLISFNFLFSKESNSTYYSVRAVHSKVEYTYFFPLHFSHRFCPVSKSHL